MKKYILTFLLTILIPVAASAVESAPNGGILNGPLMDGGHKAEGEGNRESLELAIKDLIATYGGQYPKGEEFLRRLEGIQDEKSEDFLALKKEALLANPLLDFNSLLMVRSSKGKRFTANWQTRASSEPAQRKLTEKDLDSALKNLVKSQPELKDLNKSQSEAKRTADHLKKELAKTEPYRSESNGRKRNKMVEKDPGYQKAMAAWQSEYAKLADAALKFPEYKALHDQKESGGTIPNYDDELVVMSPICDGEIRTVYKPEPAKFIGDVDLHWDGDRMLFSSHVNPGDLKEIPNTNPATGYAVFELKIDPKSGEMQGAPRRVSPDMGWDVDNYDACYLPDGRIIFASTASYEGVPCVGGNSPVANLYLMDARGENVRRLSFDQDASWHPSVLENGRVMYTRWEYTDSAHYFSRVLMTMNPDGSDQRAHYGSNSYWPNSMFFARQVPGDPNKFVATITGHHSHAKGGALCLFDVSKGRHEADGAVQFFTGRGKKVEPLVIDNLARVYSPMFFHPYPLNEKYSLAVTNKSIYLVDVFDNMLCLKKADDNGGYYEPLPLRKTAMPPAMSDRVNPKSKIANVLINDVYLGSGLKDVPRGTVKNLRVFRYEYGPRKKGGHYSMGIESCWDAKQVLGIASVEEDGSANFAIPANTPVALQPLDKDGKALQLMRSWFVGMPGEALNCVGCHENQDLSPPARPAIAMTRKPEELANWYGPTRGFSFAREVMPVVDKYCTGCHDGSSDLEHLKKEGVKIQDRIVGTGRHTGKRFSEVGIPDFSSPDIAFENLHPYVRRNGPEGDYHVLTPLEFHADTSELFQMIQKGHHNVKMDREAWDRLITWADLNAPYNGTWTEVSANQTILARRMELRKMYANVDYDPEIQINPYEKSTDVVMPARETVPRIGKIAPTKTIPVRPGTMELDLGDGISMRLAKVPPGEFAMGSNDESPAERPVNVVRIPQAFMMGVTEVTLEQYRQFDPGYLNGVYDMHWKDHVKRGYYMNDMQFPVVRVPWKKAMEFCQWLSQKTGREVTLPTEAQWEWACRGGTETPLNYGDLDADFSRHANLADVTVRQMAVKGVNPKPYENPDYRMDFELKDPRFDDGVLHLAKVGSYQPNELGLYDMHGNAAEWTRSTYQAYPYKGDDGRNGPAPGKKRVVRGGSWHDRPFRSTSTFRLGYPDWQKVYHTGFRVIAVR